MRNNAFALVNVVRDAMGLPTFVRSPAIDGTAQAHARYVAFNNAASTTESSSLPCFTGATYAQRLAAAGVVTNDLPGYRTNNEIVVGHSSASGADLQPWDIVNGTLHNVYGRMLLLNPQALQIGVGFSSMAAGLQQALVLDTALPAGATATGGTLATWPRDGATGLPTAMRATEMKPLDAGITEGYPISLHAPGALQVQRFVLTRASDGAAVPATLLTAATDRHAFLTPGEAALLPNAPLAAGTTYHVTVDASVAGVPMHLTWSFTTAP